MITNFSTYTGLDLSDIRVLVVDDTPINVLLIQKMLGRFKCEIDTAHSGEQALELIERSIDDVRSYDLVLLDIKMPGMDGYEVLEHLAASQKMSSIPVIVLSGLATNDNIAQAQRLGAVDYIQKPILMENLYDTVLKHLPVPVAS